MNYDYNKKFGLLKFYSGYGKFNLNSPKGYSQKIINAQTDNGMAGFFPKCSELQNGMAGVMIVYFSY